MRKSKLLPNIIGIALGITLVFLTADYSKADVLPINPFNTSCDPGRKEIICNTVLDRSTMDLIYDECLLYKLNPNFTELTWRKSFRNDRLIYTNKYCVSKNLPISQVYFWFGKKIYFPALLITIIIEGVVFVLFKLVKDKRSLIVFVCANVLSMSMLSVVLLFTLYKFVPILSGLMLLGGLEFLVIIFETIFFFLFNRQVSFRRVFVLFFAANILSATLGSVVYFAVFKN